MTKEQEETIKKLEYYLQNSAYKRVDSDFFKNGGWEIVDLEIPQAIETGLNIIKIKDKEIEKKDKMIDLMAEELQKHIFVLHDGDTVTSKKGIIEHYKRKATNDG